ncbi:hypothetical protein QBC37DRAFT_426139 [Rhypophila decipiens]|uniref:Uncharacterized protein n=1 Tax=Rhypophila decipiens TaxID=261697 RepID=A0AAN6Y4R5_9PEZI|nr:hypothetical protein QBC37DRAFT_426139 [Rhypophila decipiens]
MTQQIPLPAVLVGSGDPISGPCYLAISGLPEFTKWQDLADFLRYNICPRLDVYVSLNGPNNTSGWIRVIGLDMFAQVDRVLRECTFKGHQITHHDPGYNYAHGFGAILIHEPFDKDKHLFLSSDILLSPVVRQSPTRDPVWVWPQALPPHAAVQYPLTPSSPSHPAFWDFTPWRYAQGMPCQMPPHPPASQYVQPQMQTQPGYKPSLPSTHPPTPPWFCQSPLAERNQYHQAWPQAQVHTQTQQAVLKLILSWNGPYHQLSPHPGAPSCTWGPMSPTTSPITRTDPRGSHTQNTYTRKKPCTSIRGALSWLKNDAWILECSPGMAIATFPTQQHTLRAFHELSTRLEYINVRFPHGGNEELAMLESSHMMRPCTVSPVSPHAPLIKFSAGTFHN